MRFAYEPIPWRAGDTPKVSAVAGLGAGAGVGVVTPDGSGFGDLDVLTGTAPAAIGHVVLAFATAPPVLFVSADQAFGESLTVTGQGSASLTIGWTLAKLLPRRRYRLHYEWAVSK